MYFFKTLITLIPAVFAYTGEITAYGANLDNQFCGFKKDSWSNQLTAAIHISEPTTCGMCASIEFNGKRTNVLLDNHCPECKFGDIDLSHEAWQVIVGNTDYGRLKASWEYIDCSEFIKDNVIITAYDINPWWLALTPSNFRCGVSEMFIQFENQEWIKLSIGSNMNGLYFIYHNQVNPVSGKFRFKLISKLGDSIETEWYSEIKKKFDTLSQFSCTKEVNCFNRRLRRTT